MTEQTDRSTIFGRPNRSRRRWYQFSVGSLLVLVTMVAIGAAYWRRMVTTYERQAEAAEAITKLGGSVTAVPAVPDWLQWLPLAERCNKVVAVNLQESVFEEGSLKLLAQLPDIERLYLARSSVSDEDLKYVGGLAKLRRFALWRTDVTNDGLRQLDGLAELRLLDIHGNRFMDERALECLPYWPKLRLLIHDFPVTDRGLSLLAEHPNVPVTKLRANQVTDRGMNDLVRLQRLEFLIAGLECSRREIMRLSQLQQLKYLTVLGRSRLPVENLKKTMPGLMDVKARRLTEMSFRELANRWGDRAQELEIRGTYPWRAEVFNVFPVQVTITQREPLTTILAELKEVTWEDLQRFRALESIAIEGEGFGAANLAYLRELPRLRELHLRVPLSGEVMDEIAKLNRLERLDLSGYKISRFSLETDACDPLESLVDLQTFTAAVTRMEDCHLAFVRNSPKLRRVYLWDLGITGEAFNHLGKAPCLEELLVFNCHQLRNEDLEQLRAFRKLRACWVHGNYIYPSVRDSVLQSLPFLDMDPAQRKLFESGDPGLSHRALWKLPDLEPGRR